jgi:hypothetical protein
VVDEIRVLRLLQSVTDDLAVLRDEAAADDRRRADALWLRGVKYTFVTASFLQSWPRGSPARWASGMSWCMSTSMSTTTSCSPDSAIPPTWPRSSLR